jgi:hypothetical protein
VSRRDASSCQKKKKKTRAAPRVSEGIEFGKRKGAWGAAARREAAESRSTMQERRSKEAKGRTDEDRRNVERSRRGSKVQRNTLEEQTNVCVRKRERGKTLTCSELAMEASSIGERRSKKRRNVELSEERIEVPIKVCVGEKERHTERERGREERLLLDQSSPWKLPRSE